LIDELADRVAERVVERLRGGALPGWVDQTESPLGPKRHAALVRRGGPGVAKVGRRFLATREAIAAELGRLTSSPRARSKPRVLGVREELEQELGYRR
jgi:hypothetical protein